MQPRRIVDTDERRGTIRGLSCPVLYAINGRAGAMNGVTSTKQGQAALTEAQKIALIKLLADEDPAVHKVIRQRILACGAEAQSWLRPSLLVDDLVLRRRVQDILDCLARQEADNAFLAFCLNHGEDLDVEEGSWLLAKTRYPDINSSAYRALLDSYAASIRDRLAPGLEAEAIIATMNQHLFGELGFTGNEKDYYDPENSYLNRVIDRRTGNPISLCLIFLFIARRLRLPMVGIGMPGHFLCRFQTSREEAYIDPFHRGRLLKKADCVKYLQYTNHGYQESYLAPATPRRVLLRVCSNLHQSYHQLEMPSEASRLQRYIVALAK